ncbi:nucleoporin NUP42-like isoform X1 [Diorhabda carinulata]|uniref:nucleoporin NUP42-like isoform X1 n=2 Tax=Diorhabda carinulata TaxID=1163345 RepID=UPI0025A10999|nr:nucleoporin NUP42-like isoform X1 [Diorhabda carinulata]
MTVCKFFLQGNCKFGEMCKFGHDVNDNYNSFQSTGSSTTWRNPAVYGTNLTQPKINPSPGQEQKNVDINTLIKSVVTDMTQAEKGGQWLFSCYAPFKEKPAFPGFEDQSFEEIRYGYYDAIAGGSVEQFKQQIQQMAQEALLKVRSLQNPSSDLVNILVNIYNTPASSQAGIYSGNTFPNPNSSNFTFKSGPVSQQPIFAQANQNIFSNSQKNIFVGNHVFGGNNKITPNNTSDNLFIGNTQNTTNNVFARPGNTNVFQGPSEQVQASTLFSQTNSNIAVQNKSNSIFTSQQPSTGSTFGTDKQTNLFPLQSQPNSLSTNIFASPNVQPPSSTNSNANLFNTTHNPQLLNNQHQKNVTFGPHSNSVFATTHQQNNVFNNASLPQIDQSIYSKLEDLTEEEIKWFESEALDVRKIPVKPPTYDICFKK